jgi:hypothetical protein
MLQRTTDHAYKGCKALKQPRTAWSKLFASTAEGLASIQTEICLHAFGYETHVVILSSRTLFLHAWTLSLEGRARASPSIALPRGEGPLSWNALLARHDQDKPPCDASQSAVEVVAGTGEDDTVDDDDQDYEDAFNGGRSSQLRKG